MCVGRDISAKKGGWRLFSGALCTAVLSDLIHLDYLWAWRRLARVEGWSGRDARDDVLGDKLYWCCSGNSSSRSSSSNSSHSSRSSSSSSSSNRRNVITVEWR